MRNDNIYTEVYHDLFDHFGPQKWWPGETPFEIIVGAVLTQNTNWGNVSKAIDNLRGAGLLSFNSLKLLTVDEIASHIRPSGYYNLKAKRLRNLLDMIEDIYFGELDLFVEDSLESGRDNLLSVKGVGPETADSILLYACGLPTFVIDMYTHRVFSRHQLVDEETDYESMQDLFVSQLPQDVQLYNEYHALIVRVASTYCKKTNPLCEQCPLQGVNI
ncbi:MAG: endonuclease-3 related protein [Desulforhopalus sp.]|jgi:endonuclease-3 related protein